MAQRTPAPRNVVGPQVRALRTRLGWSQPMLAAKCQLAGWDVSRDIIARIELRIRWVADFELMLLADVLGVAVTDLLPRRRDLRDILRGTVMDVS